MEMGGHNNELYNQTTKTQKQHVSIMVMMDKLSKASHYILVKSTYKSINIVDIFMK